MTENSSEQNERPGFVRAIVIICFSLAAGVGLAVSPPDVQTWTMTIVAVPVTFLATVKFAASAILAWRRRAFIPSVLWAVLAILLLLMLLADGQYLQELILDGSKSG